MRSTHCSPTLAAIFTALLLYTNAIFPQVSASPLVSLTEAEAIDPKKDPHLDPACTVTSPVTGSFIDLRPLIRKGDDVNFFVKGHDYKTNFTLNICAPIASSLDTSFHGLPSNTNVSGYYVKDDVKFSIGQATHQPQFRGRKVVLEYTGGSLCPKLDEKGLPVEGQDNEDGFRKSAILAMTCDQTLFTQAAISFIGVLNECSYFFEVRTASACPTIKQQALGPISIFGVIAGVALMVYFVGGCVYQRTVMHARGWRQLPHWQTWSSAFSFVWDIIQIIFFSIINLPRRCLGHRSQSLQNNSGGGYARGSNDGRFGARGVNSNNYNDFDGARVVGGASVVGGTGNSGNNPVSSVDQWGEVDDENRLIDQLDDDWNDA